MVNYLVVVLLLFTFAFNHCFAQSKPETTLVLVNIIPGVTTQDDPTAPYNQILKRFVQLSDNPVSLAYLPGSRAAKLFAEKKAQCLFPGSKKVTHPSGEVIESKPVNIAFAYLIGRSRFSVDELLDSNGPRLHIAYRRGNTFGGTLGRLDRHLLIPVNSDQQSFGMLNSGRVDFLIGYLPDVSSLLNAKQPGFYFFDPSRPFYSQNDSMICHHNHTNEQFIRNLDHIIDRLFVTGELPSMLQVNL